jgi:hypothetical protein
MPAAADSAWLLLLDAAFNQAHRNQLRTDAVGGNEGLDRMEPSVPQER